MSQNSASPWFSQFLRDDCLRIGLFFPFDILNMPNPALPRHSRSHVWYLCRNLCGEDCPE